MTATPPTTPPTMAPIGADELPDLAAAVVLAALLLVVVEPTLDALGALKLVASIPKLLVGLLLSEVDDFDDRLDMDRVGL